MGTLTQVGKEQSAMQQQEAQEQRSALRKDVEYLKHALEADRDALKISLGALDLRLRLVPTRRYVWEADGLRSSFVSLRL